MNSGLMLKYVKEFETTTFDYMKGFLKQDTQELCLFNETTGTIENKVRELYNFKKEVSHILFFKCLKHLILGNNISR